MSSAAPHVVVAGAGVTGLTAALELARAGARVALCDPAPLGDNASGVAAGMLAPAFEAALDPAARDHFALLKEGRDLWPALADETGIALDRSGAVARGSPEWLGKVAAALAAIGADLRVGASVFTPEDWLLDSASALQALRAACEARGVARLAGALTDYRYGSDGLVIGLDHERDIPCDRLVLATGANAAFAPELAHLTPIKGHILRLPPLLPPGPVLRGEGVYLCPSESGLTIGATMEFGAADRVIDPGRVRALREAAARLLPAAAEARADVQVGVRAATPDGLPLVGPSATPGVILAAGLRRNGWLLAPLVAKVVAAYALGRDPGPHAAAFDPRRFDTSD